MKRAFTLIELLVVIAIIAILAAILFPVFAQAKNQAKKISDLSNQKQLSLSFFMYGNDTDDLMPLAYVGDNGLTLFTTPFDRDAGNWPLRAAEWANSVQPYVKNWGIYNSPGNGSDWLPFAGNPGPNFPNPTNFALSFFMNSYMNSWNSSSIDSPAQAIVMWPGQGNRDLPGFSYTTPLMLTKSHSWLQPGQFAGDNYIFQNSGADCVSGYGYFSGSWNNFRMFATGFNIARADGHAKFSAPGAVDNPWYSLNADGTPASYWINVTDYNNGCGYDWPLSPHYTQ